MDEKTIVLFVVIILSVALASLALVFVKFIFSKKRLENELEAKHIRETAELKNELRAAVSINERSLALPKLIDQAYSFQSDKIGIFIFARDTGELITGGSCNKNMVDSITSFGKLSLREALQSLESSREFFCPENGRTFLFSFRGDDLSLVYVVTDITDSRRMPELMRELDEVNEKLETSDIFTEAMNVEALLKRRDSLALGSEILLIKTDAAAAECLGGSREHYIKAVASLLRNDLGDRSAARCSADSFLCILPPNSQGKAEALLDGINKLNNILCPVDDIPLRKATAERIVYNGGSLRSLAAAAELRAEYDLKRGETGVLLRDAASLEEAASHRADLESILRERRIRFTYKPIAYSANARIYGYELTPFCPNTRYPDFDAVADSARLFGLENELERLIFEEAARVFAKALADGKLLYSANIRLSSLNGCCMKTEDARTFHERNYDCLKGFIVDMTERLPEQHLVCGIKRKRIAEWGARCAVICGEDSKNDLIRIESLRPETIIVPASLLDRKTLVKDIAARARRMGGHVIVDGINTAKELEAAIAAGAEYLQGEFVGYSDDEPGELTDRCMKKIGQIQFGKRG